MNFTKAKTENYYLHDTPVANIFLAEFMPDAPGDYVKVYLYALMQMEAGGYLSNDQIASALGLSIEDVLKAWTWFEERRIITKIYPDPKDKLRYDVVFADLKDSMFGGGSGRKKRTASGLDDARIRDLLIGIERTVGRPLSGSDPQKIISLLDDGAEPELVAYVYRYCAERKRPLSASYISRIVTDWVSKGIKTAAQAEARIFDEDQRYADYRKIMNALGQRPEVITDAEKKTFDGWLDDYELTLEEILAFAEKAAGKRNKYDYVKKIIENDYAKTHSGEQPGDIPASRAVQKTRKRFYEERLAESQSKAEQRRAEVYHKLPEVKKLDDAIRRLNIELIGASLSGKSGGKKAAAATGGQIEKKTAERTDILQAAGFPEDYMELTYFCPKCEDTGILDSGASCDCYDLR
jgi:DnaD/phage-associated family protein